MCFSHALRQHSAFFSHFCTSIAWLEMKNPEILVPCLCVAFTMARSIHSAMRWRHCSFERRLPALHQGCKLQLICNYRLHPHVEFSGTFCLICQTTSCAPHHKWCEMLSFFRLSDHLSICPCTVLGFALASHYGYPLHGNHGQPVRCGTNAVP